MRHVLIMALAAAGVLVGIGSASAQTYSADPYVTSPGYYAYDDEPSLVLPRAYAPRVYGYYRSDDDDADATVEVIRPRSCGQFRYWNGDTCVDARISPPDVD